jgi:hypothetical protein
MPACLLADAAAAAASPRAPLNYRSAKRIADAWTEKFWEKGRTAPAHAMERSFG